MELREECTESRTVYSGKIVTLLEDKVRLPNGKTAGREVVRHPGGVGVLALDGDGSVSLVRQFRYPLGRELLEIPAGKLDRSDEDPARAAARELSEETGLEADKWTSLGTLLSSPGFCDEKLYLYLAQGLHRREQHLDEDEFLDVLTVPFEQLAEKVMSGEVSDGKTVSAVLKTKILLKL